MVQMTLGIEGMACDMCEMHMNDAIKKAFKVEKVTSSFKKKKTVIVAENEILEDELDQVVSSTGYILKTFKCEPYKKSIFSFKK